ncbi:TonB-dependent receptor domain-containing protein [Neolewinella agarilytica]|uniref:Outer membrane receptor proteins, mostly Fe transport n=1 Tax=Neolewinella agarilytica TaxID=478744 RepID=A0A1H9E448_9BACT|nr:TonB-dependent receptor [Neolewinella agarilytica]SEQ20490.1 Outer membrane receptor proteins, mostly Fe transport [Neolewinella agarilytica]
MQRFLFLCFLTLLFTSVRAQGVKGTLTDATSGEPLSFANVSIYDSNQKLIKGTSSDLDGRYEIRDLAAGTYRLEASFLGYAAQSQQITLTDDKEPMELPAIALSEGGNDLEEITVTAERAVMELGLDRKVFNVEKSIAAAGGNGEDLLREIPSITVDLEGNVSLRGSEGVRFLINGKPSALTQQEGFLQTLTASNIERIEVLTNPGAQFDPEGTAGLVNIVLKQKREDGFNATVNLNAGTGNKFDGSVDLNWRKGRFNSTLGVNGRYDERYFRGFREQSATFADTSYSRYFTFDGLRQSQRQGFNLGTEYELSKRGSLALSGSYRWGEGESTNLRTTDFFNDAGELERTSFRNEAEPQTDNNYEVRMDYQTTFAKPGRSLSASLQMSESSREEVENYEEFIFSDTGLDLGGNRQNSPSVNGSKQYLGQIDYSQQIGEDFKLEAGWRSTLQRLDNVADFNVFDEDLGAFYKVDSNSNRFLYDEDVHAVYATFGGKVDKVTFSGGLRAEQVYTTSELVEPTGELFTNNYFKVYPSVFLGYSLSENSTLQASYSRRVNRPRDRDLNPFVDRGDPLNLRTGNPFLLPEIINSYELNVQQRLGRGTFTGGVYYRAKSDLLTRVTETLPGGVQIGTRANLDSGRDYGVELIGTFRPTKKLDLTASANGYRTELDGTLEEGTVQADGFKFDARLQGSYELPWDVKSQFTYYYRSPGVTAQGQFNGFQGLDLGFRKPILDDLGAITLRVTDVFNQRKFGYSTEIDGLVTSSEFQRESRILYVGFQYSLRQVKGKPKRSQSGDRGDDGGTDF